MIHHAAERKKIAARVEFQTARLFGRHEVRCAGEHAGLREAGIFVGHTCKAEVQNFDAIVVFADPDVRGFDIAMNELPFMSRRQSGSDLDNELANGTFVQRSGFSNQTCLKCFSWQPLHCDECQTILLANLIDGDDVVVFNRSRKSGFGDEAITSEWSQRRSQYFQCDHSIERSIFRHENDACSPCPD